MRADDIDIALQDLSAADTALLSRVKSRQDAMETRVRGWSSVNTGSWNADGLNAFSHELAAALGQTDAKVDFIDTKPIEIIGTAISLDRPLLCK